MDDFDLDIGELEVPVAPMHPGVGGAVVNGHQRVRTGVRAGTLAAQGNIVQCYPGVISPPPVVLPRPGGG
jgi:hypothetical protein